MTLVMRDVVLPLSEFTLEVSVTLDAPTTALYGPSGAGKTTLLELIAGIRKPYVGQMQLNGRVVFDRGVFVSPRQRRVGYVPQDDALFPHLSVRQNVFYGAARKNGDDRGDDVIDVLEIGALLDRGIRHLSGGERKRIALARALLTRPEILLLDEPLAGVDVALRDRVLAFLLRVRDEFPIPMIYVTHHMQEVEAICEEIIVLERGKVVAQRRVASPV
jgi:molybdate transport system ATP-binding protein